MRLPKRIAVMPALGAGILGLALAASPSLADQAPRYRFLFDALRTCPGDTIVWINDRSGRYYYRRQVGYSSIKNGPGGFACKSVADKAGHKPAYAGPPPGRTPPYAPN